MSVILLRFLSDVAFKGT